MYYISEIKGDSVYVTDTSDNAVDTFNKAELKKVMTSNPDLVIKGVGISMISSGLKFLFSVYKLSALDELRIAGASAPIVKFTRLDGDKAPRNHYFCYKCNNLLDSNQLICNCGARIIPNNIKASRNYICDSMGNKFFYISVNGARNRFKERIIGQQYAI